MNNTRVTECRACNGYRRLPDQPDRNCRYCYGKGYSCELVDRELTESEQAYIAELIAEGTLDPDWNS